MNRVCWLVCFHQRKGRKGSSYFSQAKVFMLSGNDAHPYGRNVSAFKQVLVSDFSAEEWSLTPHQPERMTNCREMSKLHLFRYSVIALQHYFVCGFTNLHEENTTVHFFRNMIALVIFPNMPQTHNFRAGMICRS